MREFPILFNAPMVPQHYTSGLRLSVLPGAHTIQRGMSPPLMTSPPTVNQPTSPGQEKQGDHHDTEDQVQLLAQ
ncbi:hypothetical protein HBF26_14365 [Luteibacter jiangsuensis]|uniref:Uncharacterized protein n=1 Tax=Luteibacter jiangsuensis TaxID=637577 RepID=A0ABX0Q6D2_9GAMM|nr:hypothetical protein [Luteibacter jiangsuensis]NID06079.1 hypothetical protein [Luteibacter jiangsuensis]